MPMLINQDGLIERITFDDQPAAIGRIEDSFWDYLRKALRWWL